MGAYTGDAITTGEQNVAVGDAALTANITGTDNVAIGDQSLKVNTASNNTAVGSSALLANTTGSQNVAVGQVALKSNTTASGSVAIGYDSLQGSTGHSNTAVGTSALVSVSSGDSNVSLGKSAGWDITTGDHNISIGTDCRSGSAASDHRITIGSALISAGNNSFTFGRDTGSHRVYNFFDSNASWTRVSDERLKKNIATNTDCGLAFINDLRTVTYNFKAPSELDETMSEYDSSKTEALHTDKMYGFIAQEVKAALDTHNITNFNGWNQLEDDGDNLQGISYEMFVMPLVKAIQELSTKNDALVARITALEA